jgi:hypothetical protein
MTIRFMASLLGSFLAGGLVGWLWQLDHVVYLEARLDKYRDYVRTLEGKNP